MKELLIYDEFIGILDFDRSYCFQNPVGLLGPSL